MPRLDIPGEHHSSARTARLRAVASDADSGVVFMASLILGVAAAGADRSTVLVASVGALIAAPLVLAAGRYCLNVTRAGRVSDRESEITALTGRYEERGLDQRLARRVAVQLLANRPSAHEASPVARPIRAALGAAGLAIGAAPPVLAFAFAPETWAIGATAATALVCLAGLGPIAEEANDGPWTPMLRAIGGGTLAVAFSVGAGLLVRAST